MAEVSGIILIAFLAAKEYHMAFICLLLGGFTVQGLDLIRLQGFGYQAGVEFMVPGILNVSQIAETYPQNLTTIKGPEVVQISGLDGPASYC